MKLQMTFCVRAVAALALLGYTASSARGQWVDNSEFYGTNSTSPGVQHFGDPLSCMTGSSQIWVGFYETTLIMSPSANAV